jgi:hypothetical protein
VLRTFPNPKPSQLGHNPGARWRCPPSTTPLGVTCCLVQAIEHVLGCVPPGTHQVHPDPNDSLPRPHSPPCMETDWCFDDDATLQQSTPSAKSFSAAAWWGAGVCPPTRRRRCAHRPPTCTSRRRRTAPARASSAAPPHLPRQEMPNLAERSQTDVQVAQPASRRTAFNR